MGADPGTAMILSSLISGGLGLAGGAMSGGGQEMSSFEGDPQIGPHQLMKDFMPMFEGTYRDATQRAHQGVELPSAYVQDLPTFTGGGLPMPIGLSARDPALANRDLTQISGDGHIGSYTPSGGILPNSPGARQGQANYGTGQAPGTSLFGGTNNAVARRTSGNPGNEPTDLGIPKPFDSLDQGGAAAQLLLEALAK